MLRKVECVKVDNKKSFVKNIIHWAENGNVRSFPWRMTSNLWHIALAEILLTRTPAQRVLPVFQELVKKYPLPTKNIDTIDLLKTLKVLGLQERKTTQIQMLANLLCQTKSREALLEELRGVPGIGKYTYNAVLLFGFGIIRPIVDANVGRIFTRYFGLKLRSKAASDDDAWKLAYELLPREVDKAKIYSYGLLDFGSEICKKKPLCTSCPLSSHCTLFKKIS